MALVGPRPERPEFTERLAERIVDYHCRHLVRPGITGLAQINLEPDQTLDDVRRKLILDLEHVRRANLGFDARILFCTLLRAFFVRGRLLVRLLGLSRKPVLPGECASYQREESASVPIERPLQPR